MDSIDADFGMGEEAIEVGLARIREQCEVEKLKIDQIVLIGDMPANPLDKIMTKRAENKKGWDSTPFKDPVNYKDELNKLKDLGVKINSFYLTNAAKSCFEEISGQTEGKSLFLDVNGADAPEKLTHIVAWSVMKSAGDDYADAYTQAFPISLGYIA
eukprot:gene12864-17240_t